MSDLNQSLIRAWMFKVGLDNTTPESQFAVLEREVEELRKALGDFISSPQALVESDKLEDKLLDELGDVIVTTFTLAEALGAKWQRVFSNAYIKIDSRDGIVKNGIFIKSDDLEEPGKI